MGSKKKKKEIKRQNKLQEKEQSKTSTYGSNNSDSKRLYFVLVSILVFTFICFSPSLNNGFVNWDDDRNFVENEHITSLNNQNFWENTAKIFKSDVIGGYNPLTIWTFLIEQKLFGQDKPMYWHLNNILLHLACCFFVFFIGLRLRLGLLGTSLLTLLFAIHPMRVESVAWVTERKDVLYGVFYFAAIFYYIKNKQEGKKIKYSIIIAICFLLSLLSKIQAVILPLSLILVDYYLSKDHSLKIKSIIRKWPYFLGSLLVGIMGIYFLKDQGSTDQEYTGISRLFIGSYSLMVYYIKSVVPFRMSPLYPYPSSLAWYFYPSILSFIGTGYLLWIAYRKRWTAIFFGVGFFLVNVVLLLQILGAGQGFLADRFTYVPYFGLFFIYSFFIEKLINRFPAKAIIIKGLTVAVLLVYSFLCFQQNKIWENSETLWSHVLKYYTKTTLPWGNRANYYRDSNQVQKALNDYGQVIRLKPDRPEAYNSRARLYFNFNQRDSLLKALDNYNKAIELKPDDPEYLVNRGATYAKLGDLNNAMVNLNQAEQIDPSFANTYLNRSVIYNNNRDWPNALKDIDKYLSIKPYHSDMWYEKARLHAALNQFNDFIAASNQAIALAPNNGLYHYERARALFLFSQFNDARSSMQKAISLGYKGDHALVNQIMNRN